MGARAIGVVNQKGGVAKTTTAREAAAMLAAEGRRVLAIDLDAQHNLTDFFLGGVRPRMAAHDVLMGAPLADAAVGTGRVGLDLLPSDDRSYLMGPHGPTEADVRELMREAARAGYDHIVIDFPRAMTRATMAAMAACGVLVIPTEASRMSAEAVAQTLAAVDEIADPPEALILVTRHNARTNIARDYVALIEGLAAQHGARVMAARIPLSAAVAEAEGYGLTLDEHKPRSRPAEAYHAFLRELHRYI